eukprot:gene56029-16383_t
MYNGRRGVVLGHGEDGKVQVGGTQVFDLYPRNLRALPAAAALEYSGDGAGGAGETRIDPSDGAAYSLADFVGCCSRSRSRGRGRGRGPGRSNGSGPAARQYAALEEQQQQRAAPPAAGGLPDGRVDKAVLAEDDGGPPSGRPPSDP